MVFINDRFDISEYAFKMQVLQRLVSGEGADS